MCSRSLVKDKENHVFPFLFWSVVATICCVVIRGKVNHLLCAFPVGASFLMVGSRGLDLNCGRKGFCLDLTETALALEFLSEVKTFPAFLWKSSYLEDGSCSCCICVLYILTERGKISISSYCCTESRAALSISAHHLCYG